ncbi:MAG: hypothetical protein QXR85_01950 [Candidatus Micrarchaeaceae archaeon]
MNKFVIRFEDLPQIIDTQKIIKTTHGHLTMRMLNYAIQKYIKDNKLIKIKRGIYSKSTNPFYVATKIYRGYIGFSSALFLYRLKTEVEKNVFVCTASSMKPTRFLDKELVPVNVSRYAFGTEYVDSNGLEVSVSTYPKTIFDMFLRPGYANYFDLYRALHTRILEHDEWKALEHYLRGASLTTIRRAGYALEEEAPGWFTERLKKLSDKGSRSSFFFKHKMLRYNSSWNIFDDIDIKKWKNAE